jgi:long-chain fatty acid transport protein
VRATLLALTSCLLPSWAYGSGFYIDEQGAQATGKAGAYVADAADASSVFYNPAGVGRLDRITFVAGAQWVAPSTSFEQAADATKLHATYPTSLVPNAYATYAPAHNFGVGIGLSAPFGSAIKWSWPQSSEGRYTAREQSLQAEFISLVVAKDASAQVEGLSIGAGLDLVPASLRLLRDVPLGDGEGSLKLQGQAFGVGGRLGLLYKSPTSGLALGLSYRSPVSLRFYGDGDFRVVDPTPRSALPANGPVTTSITLPDALVFGVALTPAPALQLELDASWNGWSRFDKLAITLPDESTSTSPRGYRDTFAVRAGGRVLLGPLSLRAGFAYDMSPVPSQHLDPGLPDANRMLAACGLGLALGQWQVDTALLYVLPTSRDSGKDAPIAGRYAISAYVASVNVGVVFGPTAVAAKTPSPAEEAPAL